MVKLEVPKMAKLEMDAGIPASNESFVLQRLQARLQELESENEELLAHCETSDDLLISLQENLEETGADVEDAEARVRELELQLEEQEASAAGSSSNLLGGLVVQVLLLGLLAACALGASLGSGAADGGASGQAWRVGRHALLVAPELLGLAFGIASGRMAAVRAACVPPLVHHTLATIAHWLLGVDPLTFRAEARQPSTAAWLHILAFASALLVFCNTREFEGRPAVAKRAPSHRREGKGGERSPATPTVQDSPEGSPDGAGRTSPQAIRLRRAASCPAAGSTPRAVSPASQRKAREQGLSPSPPLPAAAEGGYDDLPSPSFSLNRELFHGAAQARRRAPPPAHLSCGD